MVASAWPHVEASLQAANVVSHSIVSHLAQCGEFELSYGYIGTTVEEIPDRARNEIDALKRDGVTFLEPLLLDLPSPIRTRPWLLIKALVANPESILPGHNAGEQLRTLLDGRQIDAVLTIWTETGLNTASKLPALRFAYHGNPDPKVFDAQHEAMRLAGAQPRGLAALADSLRRFILRNILERAHLSVLRCYDFVADVAANDAADYASKGINAAYMCNMWPMVPPDDWEAKRDELEAANPGKIVGSVGSVSGTANSLGFAALNREVLPALERRLDGNPFEVHVYGRGEPRPFIKPLLDSPHIHVRGFVEDLNAEILSAPVFLISNNHYRFKVGHTRFLHAWSLGGCVVAFADCREAMPEIEHGHNALLGRSAEEVADLVAQALADRNLRRRIGRGGVGTLAKYYAPQVVVPQLIDRIRQETLRRTQSQTTRADAI